MRPNSMCTLPKTLIFLGLLSIGIAFIGCGKNGGGQNPGGPGSGGSGGGGSGGGGANDTGARYGKVKLRSSQYTALAMTSTLDSDCGQSLDIYRLEGVCLTPLSFSGHAMKVDLSADVMGMGPVRAMSLDEESSTAGVILPGTTFNFDSTGSSLVGNNTLLTAYDAKPQFKGLSVDLAYRQFKVSLKGQYVTVLIPSYPQPFAAAAKSLCGFDDEVAAQERYEKANLISNMTFSRGDYLFCVKNTATESCAASDYQWLDLTSKTLVSTRPASPKKSAYLAGTSIVCSGEQGRYGFNFKNAPVYALIDSAQQFKLYGDYSHGNLSHQYASENAPFGDTSISQIQGAVGPYMYYSYQPTSGASSTGSELTMEFNFNFANSLVIEGIRSGDVSGKTLPELLVNLHEISLWVHDKKFNDNVEGGFASHYAVIKATPTITLSGGKSPPKAKANF